MRKADAALERRNQPLTATRDRTACELICIALILAVATLLCRIASIW
jgi:hypothetical protein